MSEPTYDEFGNYIGPAFSPSESSDNEPVYASDETHLPQQSAPMETSASVVLFEEKRYYTPAEALYEGAEVRVEQEDAQPLSQPIIAPTRHPKYEILESTPPPLNYSMEFFGALLDNPHLVRNVALGGSIGSGKSSFVDELISATWSADPSEWLNYKPPRDLSPALQRVRGRTRYMDNRLDEREREMTIRGKFVSMVLEGSLPSGPQMHKKHYLVNLIDTPGHPELLDEFTAACRASDSAVLAVDALIGPDIHFARLVRIAISEQLPIILLITKLDRLFLELRLPPEDAFYKLRKVIDEAEKVVCSIGGLVGSDATRFDRNNVVFSSAKLGFTFTLESFAALHLEISGDSQGNRESLADAVWDGHWDGERLSKRPGPNSAPAFASFVLDPLYKIACACATEDSRPLRELGIAMNRTDWKETGNTWALMRQAFSRFFGAQKFPGSSSKIPKVLFDATAATGSVDNMGGARIGGGAGVHSLVGILANQTPNSREGALKKLCQYNVGKINSPSATTSPTIIHFIRQYRDGSGNFNVLARVLSGGVAVGDKLRVVIGSSEGYLQVDEKVARKFRSVTESCSLFCPSPATEEQTFNSQVSLISIPVGRSRATCGFAPVGSLVLLQGCDYQGKHATAFGGVPSDLLQQHILPTGHCFPGLSLKFGSVCRVPVEPKLPSSLPAFSAALRSIERCFPAVQASVAESGEHSLAGAGELYMDCVLRELKEFHGVEVRVAPPTVALR